MTSEIPETSETPETEWATVDYVVDIVAVDPDGQVLEIQRRWDPFAGKWALPGGYVDAGETSKRAAVRELGEETGVEVTEDDLILVGVFDTPDRDPRGRVVSVAYAALVPAGTTAVAADDAAATRWMPLTADPDDLAFDHAEILHTARGTLAWAGLPRL
ncbi:NUDIX hydrolase [Streptomyces sp. NBC_01506]|uniref:NUDIX hydrolase n=1 Tax=Streptomyces sp. NBC_01506 TaxID=2903887 RepID=UPI002F91828B